jgi:hypothetical protein
VETIVNVNPEASTAQLHPSIHIYLAVVDYDDNDESSLCDPSSLAAGGWLGRGLCPLYYF